MNKKFLLKQLQNKQKYITFENEKKMGRYVSEERKRLEHELLNYLRNWRFFAARFKRIENLEAIVDQIVHELKSDI